MGDPTCFNIKLILPKAHYTQGPWPGHTDYRKQGEFEEKHLQFCRDKSGSKTMRPTRRQLLNQNKTTQTLKVLKTHENSVDLISSLFPSKCAS